MKLEINFRKRLYQNQQGFTLIELLAVLSIISLLASTILFSTVSARVKARDARRKADMAQLQKALELYYNAFGEYPWSGSAPHNWSMSNDTASWNALQTKLAPFMARLPQDPNQSATGNVLNQANVYAYAYWSGDWNCSAGQYYVIVYKLERWDPAQPVSGNCYVGYTFQYSPPYTAATNNVTTVVNGRK